MPSRLMSLFGRMMSGDVHSWLRKNCPKSPSVAPLLASNLLDYGGAIYHEPTSRDVARPTEIPSKGMSSGEVML